MARHGPAPKGRDPARIPALLERLRVAWEREPDLLLAQIINLAGRDPYIEDEDLIARIEKRLALPKGATRGDGVDKAA